MPRLDRISAPPADYCIYTGRNEHLQHFETAEESRARDQSRVRTLRARAASPDCTDRLGYARLADRIESSADRRSRSLASATYMRDLRQRVGGQLWATVARTLNLGPYTCTMFPRGWEVSVGQLHTFNPVARIAALRSLINRCGGDTAGGYLVGFIHGEFEPRRQVYGLHPHIVAAGGLRDVLDKVVRHTPTVRSIRAEYGDTDWVYQRFRMDRQLTCLPAPLTYMLKSYWPSKWQGVNAEGKLIRQRKGSRIAEPYHSEVLRWLDSHRLSDITLLMNISVGRDGFRLSDRAYTNGTN